MDKEILKLLLQAALQQPTEVIQGTEKMGKYIVVLQRGWVFVGDLERRGSEFRLTNASNVRKWGTKQGLGELAKKGPLSETQLDPCNDVVEWHELTTVFRLKCSEDNWK